MIDQEFEDEHKYSNQLLGLATFCWGFFVLTFIAHFSTYFNINPSNYFSGLWIFHFLMFPIVLSINYYIRKLNIKFNFFLFLRIVPHHYKNIFLVVIVYTIVNFFIFLFNSGGGGPDIMNNEYVLNSHGHILEYLTKEEYEFLKVLEFRGFSGHWMFFYFTPAFIYSLIRKKSLLNKYKMYEYSSDR